MNLYRLLHPSDGAGPAEDFNGPDTDFARRHPLRILITDDNYINRRVLLLLLQRLGYAADSTENGHDCLNAVLERPYDLLLIDINMPDMSGIECAEMIRRSGRSFPIVAVTATAPEVSQQQSVAAGMNGFIAKPIRLPELKRALLEASLAREDKDGAARPGPEVRRQPQSDGAGHGDVGAGHLLRMAL